MSTGKVRVCIDLDEEDYKVWMDSVSKLNELGGNVTLENVLAETIKRMTLMLKEMESRLSQMSKGTEKRPSLINRISLMLKGRKEK